MIVAQEQDIVERVQKDEEAAEGQRLEIARIESSKKEEIQQKIEEATKLIDEEKLSQAMEIINVSEDIRDGVILHYNTMGMKDREIKQFDEAISNYSKAISVSPEDENLHYNIARAYFEASKRDKAEEYLGKALKLNPEFKEGKVFYNYLLKLDQAQENKSKSEKKTGGIFQNIFHSQK
jgi:tetratricopeptide (TPR) repeat protein